MVRSRFPYEKKDDERRDVIIKEGNDDVTGRPGVDSREKSDVMGGHDDVTDPGKHLAGSDAEMESGSIPRSQRSSMGAHTWE